MTSQEKMPAPLAELAFLFTDCQIMARTIDY